MKFETQTSVLDNAQKVQMWKNIPQENLPAADNKTLRLKNEPFQLIKTPRRETVWRYWDLKPDLCRLNLVYCE